jgi:hypothetical protein
MARRGYSGGLAVATSQRRCAVAVALGPRAVAGPSLLVPAALPRAQVGGRARPLLLAVRMRRSVPEAA